MMKTMIEVENLKKDYRMPTGPLPVLKGINFELYQGEMLFVVGRSGSGKSTLLHLLGGLDRASSGKILFDGQDVAGMNEKELSLLRNSKLGYVFQFYHLMPELTLFENVMLPMMIAGKPERHWVRDLLKKVKLWSRRNHYPSELSGGEQQRAAIARALVNRPQVLLCDEPTGNLDEETAGTIYALLSEINQKDGQSLIIVTHDANWAWGNSRVLKLQEGVLISDNRGEIHIEQVY